MAKLIICQHQFEERTLQKIKSVETLTKKIENTKKEIEETATAKIEKELEKRDNTAKTSSTKLNSSKSQT